MATDTSFAEPLADMLATGQSVDRDGAKVTMTGFSSLNSLHILRNLHRRYKAARTLEVGLAYAGSCLVFNQVHAELGHAEPRQHVAIDPFQSHINYSGIAIMEKAGLTQYFEHIEDFSDRALPALVERGDRFDLIYIDGSHLFEDVFLDCHYCTQLLNREGVVVFDDSTDPHIRKVLDFARTNMTHVLEELDLGPYRLDGGASMRHKVGKLLGKSQLTAFRKIGEGRRQWASKLAPF